MADYFKFPNGNNVKVLKAEDVLECINKNITDIDVAKAVIYNCEKQIKEELERGNWVGVPFLGNIKRKENKILRETKEQQELINKAKQELTLEDYKEFKKNLCLDNDEIIRNKRNIKYKASILANKNKKLYFRLLKTKGESYTKRHFIFLTGVKVVGDGTEN